MLRPKATFMRALAAGITVTLLGGCASSGADLKLSALSASERSMSCGKIRRVMRRMANEVVIADAKTRDEVVSSVALGVLFGVAAVATYRIASDAGEAGKLANRHRAKLDNFNRTLSAKKCKTWNYEGYISAKNAKIAAKNAKTRQEGNDGVGLRAITK